MPDNQHIVTGEAMERIMAEPADDGTWRAGIQRFEIGLYDREIVSDERGHCFPAGNEEAVQTRPPPDEEAFL